MKHIAPFLTTLLLAAAGAAAKPLKVFDGHVYPNHNKPDRFELYSELLADFIRDVRKDLGAPKLPFVIGGMGVGGLKEESTDMLAFRRAMAAPAAMPEFKDNVVAVETAPFWSAELGAIADKHEKINHEYA